jgi:pimeloyl-ACP methyl ester carboxylesterase
MTLPAPVIVVPGITASYLSDEYPVTPELVWTVMTKEFERIRLHPDDVKYEAHQPSRVRSGQLYEVAYKELIQELRHNLSRHDDEPVPVFPFAYDWRQPLQATEAQFAAFVQEVVERTALLRHYAEDGYTKKNGRVNLVGHSMGGLIIAGYMADQAGKAPVNKVATLATPYRGSFEAIVKVLTGTADLGTSAPSSREREAARVMPALYHLMPTVKIGLAIDPSLPKSIFEADAWQPSIRQTIEEYVRLYAVDPGGKAQRGQQADQLFRSLLDVAKKHRAKIESLDLPTIGMSADRWLAVVGVGSETRVKMEIATSGGKPCFVLNSDDRADQYDEKNPEAAGSAMTGDGTVPYEGAIPGFLRPENLVCVTPDDYGYWEVQDRLTSSVAGFHGILPNMDMLHRLIVRHFTEAKDPHENTWGRRAPGVASTAWAPPLKLRMK